MRGYDVNPLGRFPDKQACFCGSKALSFECCKPGMSRVIPHADAERIALNWERILSGKFFVQMGVVDVGEEE